METWRLMDTGYLSAAENMALDDVLLECRAKAIIPNTIRFLQFAPPAVLVGYHQDIGQEIRLEYVNNHGIEVNRRLTGGGAIYFDTSSLGWEIIASKASVPYSGPEHIFRIMCEGTINALNNLGIQAEFRPKNDIEVNGKKISGTGGTERGGAFLFQGTLLIDFDVEVMVRSLRIPIAKLKDKELKSAKERVTCIKWELGFIPDYREIKEALKRGFEETLGIELAEDKLNITEKRLLENRLSEFQSEEWVYLDRRPLEEAAIVQAIDKTPGGLIRVSLAIDKGANLIKSALITGDFYAFPSRAILDLESKLKFAPCEEERIRDIVHSFFTTNEVIMPGITPDHIADSILEAVGRTSYENFGISLFEMNHLYPVNKNMKDILKDNYDYLLLPYCSKLPSCDYRDKEGCLKCGECSIGEAYEMAEAMGLKPITIQSFEHLMDTLKAIGDEGTRGYIGCCCEAFYCKHKDEIEESGVPGFLIDIDDTTCYDLGMENEAYKGSFEAQTQLKLDLLSVLLNQISSRETANLR
jgi:lipoate-protein ligase A